MKSIYNIYEGILSGYEDTINKSDKEIERLTPKTKEELVSLIQDEVKRNGWNCDLNHINTEYITDMSDLFAKFDGYNLDIFNGDISQWDVSKVENMSYMFNRSKFNRDISKWNVSNVTDMRDMFVWSKFNGDISNWNVSKVKYMNSMFYGSDFNGNISKWDVRNVTNMNSMFVWSKFKRDISKWKINKNCLTKDMFNDCQIKEKYKPELP